MTVSNYYARNDGALENAYYRIVNIDYPIFQEEWPGSLMVIWQGLFQAGGLGIIGGGMQRSRQGKY